LKVAAKKCKICSVCGLCKPLVLHPFCTIVDPATLMLQVWLGLLETITCVFVAEADCQVHPWTVCRAFTVQLLGGYGLHQAIGV